MERGGRGGGEPGACRLPAEAWQGAAEATAGTVALRRLKRDQLRRVRKVAPIAGSCAAESWAAAQRLVREDAPCTQDVARIRVDSSRRAGSSSRRPATSSRHSLVTPPLGLFTHSGGTGHSKRQLDFPLLLFLSHLAEQDGYWKQGPAGRLPHLLCRLGPGDDGVLLLRTCHLVRRHWLSPATLRCSFPQQRQLPVRRHQVIPGRRMRAWSVAGRIDTVREATKHFVECFDAKHLIIDRGTRRCDL